MSSNRDPKPSTGSGHRFPSQDGDSASARISGQDGLQEPSSQPVVPTQPVDPFVGSALGLYIASPHSSPPPPLPLPLVNPAAPLPPLPLPIARTLPPLPQIINPLLAAPAPGGRVGHGYGVGQGHGGGATPALVWDVRTERFPALPPTARCAPVFVDAPHVQEWVFLLVVSVPAPGTSTGYATSPVANVTVRGVLGQGLRVADLLWAVHGELYREFYRGQTAGGGSSGSPGLGSLSPSFSGLSAGGRATRGRFGVHAGYVGHRGSTELLRSARMTRSARTPFVAGDIPMDVVRVVDVLPFCIGDRRGRLVWQGVECVADGLGGMRFAVKLALV